MTVGGGCAVYVGKTTSVYFGPRRIEVVDRQPSPRDLHRDPPFRGRVPAPIIPPGSFGVDGPIYATSNLAGQISKARERLAALTR